ncbi:hypothetical protein [Paraburkholderia sp. RL17-337-BIB-A]|uniref:hypothetical protein n=1 Tax=Paraburkholderia sp. RL17-337-BIB-A TaxID=3031636 RepID=UPI0038BDE281
MKTDLIGNLTGKQSSPDKKPTAGTGNAMAFAQYLGLPGRVAAAAKSAPAKAQAVAAKALRKPAASLTPAAKHAPAQGSAKPAPAATKATAKATKAARRQATAMPFSEAMGGFKSAAHDQHAGTTELWPEVIGGVATGRFIKVQRTETTAPKLDASAVGRQIVAAGERLNGNK